MIMPHLPVACPHEKNVNAKPVEHWSARPEQALTRPAGRFTIVGIRPRISDSRGDGYGHFGRLDGGERVRVPDLRPGLARMAFLSPADFPFDPPVHAVPSDAVPLE